MKLIDEAAVEYEDYRAEYEMMKGKKKEAEADRQGRSLKRVEKDLEEEGLCSVRKEIRYVF